MKEAGSRVIHRYRNKTEEIMQQCFELFCKSNVCCSCTYDHLEQYKPSIASFFVVVQNITQSQVLRLEQEIVIA